MSFSTKYAPSTNKDAGMTQDQLATKLSKPQSFTAKIEGGERGLDVIEFASIIETLDVDGPHILQVLRTTSGD